MSKTTETMWCILGGFGEFELDSLARCEAESIQRFTKKPPTKAQKAFEDSNKAGYFECKPVKVTIETIEE